MANPIYSEVFHFLDISDDEFIVLNDNLDCPYFIIWEVLLAITR